VRSTSRRGSYNFHFVPGSSRGDTLGTMGNSCACVVQSSYNAEASFIRPASPDVESMVRGDNPNSLDDQSKTCSSSPSSTLAQQLLAAPDHKFSSRQLAKLQRRAIMRSRSSFPKGDKSRFLSGLPEVEADIAFRFTFVVVGGAATNAVSAACQSKAARSSPGGETYRCLCSVGTDRTGEQNWGGPSSEQESSLARLAFYPVGPGESVPPCASRLEASSTVVVFALLLDACGDTDFLEMQLWSSAQQVERSQQEACSPHRPHWAVMLCYEDGAKSDWADGRWMETLALFEKQYGRLWTFGPMSLADADGLHGTFAEMASTRILRGKTKGGQGQGQEDDIDTASEASLGYQQPPVFEAESSSDEMPDCKSMAMSGTWRLTARSV